MKKDIEKAYVNAVYDDIAPNVFADTILNLFGKDEKQTRTSAQNRARWKYLSMCSTILNEQGLTYNPPGMTIEVPFTKDLLYEMYWSTTRKHMYPQKKKQLNTKEFKDLVDMVMMLFAKVFKISIPFPNWKDYAIDKQ